MTQVMNKQQIASLVSSAVEDAVAKFFSDNGVKEVEVKVPPTTSNSVSANVSPGVRVIKTRIANVGSFAKKLLTDADVVSFKSGASNALIRGGVFENGNDKPIQHGLVAYGWELKRDKALDDANGTPAYTGVHESGVTRTFFMGKYNAKTKTHGRKEAVLV